jgi:membrane-associated phospholipid phosphatase
MFDAFHSFNLDTYLFLQELMGRSWLFDSLISLATSNQLVKAVVIGCCFVAAWFSAGEEKVYRTRRTLVLTILAGVIAIGLCKGISKSVLSPRPLLFASNLYLLEGQSFTKSESLKLREPLDEEGQAYVRNFAGGGFDDDDLVSFPSDHAALFVSISVGILLIHRSLGSLAMIWTIVVILLPRIISGMHWPADIAAGAAIGGVCTVLVVSIFNKRTIPVLDRLIKWSLGQPALSSALVFAVIFEACNSYYNIRLVLRFVREALRNMMGG